MQFKKSGKSEGVLCYALPCLRSLVCMTILGLTLLSTTLAFADDAVQLKVLVVSTGPETEDPGLAYIKPVLDEMGVLYDILDASTTSLTAAMLSPNGCAAATLGCLGNYNGIILTNSDAGQNFTPSEWEILHQYEKDFHTYPKAGGDHPPV